MEWWETESMSKSENENVNVSFARDVLRFRVAVLVGGRRGPPHPSPLPEERVLRRKFPTKFPTKFYD